MSPLPLSSTNSAGGRYYQRTGRLNSPEFFDERCRVFRELDMLLDGVTRRGLGVPGYADHYGRIAEVSKWMSRAGWLAVGFSATSTVSNVRAACATGREHECNPASKNRLPLVGLYWVVPLAVLLALRWRALFVLRLGRVQAASVGLPVR